MAKVQSVKKCTLLLWVAVLMSVATNAAHAKDNASVSQARLACETGASFDYDRAVSACKGSETEVRVCKGQAGDRLADAMDSCRRMSKVGAQRLGVDQPKLLQNQ